MPRLTRLAGTFQEQHGLHTLDIWPHDLSQRLNQYLMRHILLQQLTALVRVVDTEELFLNFLIREGRFILNREWFHPIPEKFTAFSPAYGNCLI